MCVESDRPLGSAAALVLYQNSYILENEMGTHFKRAGSCLHISLHLQVTKFPSRYSSDTVDPL